MATGLSRSSFKTVSASEPFSRSWPVPGAEMTSKPHKSSTKSGNRASLTRGRLMKCTARLWSEAERMKETPCIYPCLPAYCTYRYTCIALFTFSATSSSLRPPYFMQASALAYCFACCTITCRFEAWLRGLGLQDCSFSLILTRWPEHASCQPVPLFSCKLKTLNTTVTIPPPTSIKRSQINKSYSF